MTVALPGVRFEALPPRPDDAGPRMDVAGFAGFAACGPVDVPVLVEDAYQLETVFGGDATLYVDATTGTAVRAHLVPAVRAFLRSGGQRCWVVRVTGRRSTAPGTIVSAAVRRGVPVTGLAVRGAAGLSGVRMAARSVGAWADPVVARVEVDAVPVATEPPVPPVRSGDAVTWRCPATLGPGELLRVTYVDAERKPLGALYGFADGTGGVADLLAVDATGAAVPVGVPGGTPEPVVRLTVRLVVTDVDGTGRSLENTGLHPAHPRWLGLLPTDEQLYRAAADPDHPRDAAPALWTEVAGGSHPARPRFPLAAPTAPGPCYPLDAALPGTPSEDSSDPDGLAGVDPALVVGDPALRGLGVGALRATADHLRWTAEHPRALLGAHAFLDLDDVTLMCAPDVTHRPWEPAPASAPLPPPPPTEALETTGEPADGGDPAGGGPFAPCAPAAGLPTPTGLRHASIAGQLSWEGVTDAVGYRVAATESPLTWAGAVQTAVTTTALTLVRTRGTTYYRVRAVGADGSVSDWSAGLAVAVPGATGWRTAEPRPDSLLAAHTDLVTLCAARGDALALLSVPADATVGTAAAHATALRGPLDERTASFGALYHPWPRLGTGGPYGADGTDGTDPVAVPPEGLIAGSAAGRARRFGAWVAPANEVFADVVGLAPRAPDSTADLAILQGARVNALRREPRGFCCLAADTLSADRDLGEITVRRLLALVRRVAAVAGTDLVFAADDGVFRRRVHRTFDAVLGRLLAQGAFAGTTAAQSYQIVVAPRGVPAVEGRLVVDLKVAPSVPLRFLTVRLTGADGPTTVEVPGDR